MDPYAEPDPEPFLVRCTAMVQARIVDPVVAVGLLTRVDLLRDVVLGKTSSAVSSRLVERRRATADGLPASTLVALTARHLRCFGYGLRGRELEVHHEAACFARDGMRIDFSTTVLADRIDVVLADGAVLPFESMRGHDLNDELFRHLLGVYRS